MSFFVSCIRNGRVHRFAYPHANLDTALGFACEILQLEQCDVWVRDEKGETIADRNDVAEYADEIDSDYTKSG
jgi:hypothetical protein